jgi:hypothetical protein
MNGIKAVEDMRQAGYPIPSDEELLSLPPDCGGWEVCVIGEGQPGCACPSRFCGSETYVNGCCPAGACLL